MSKPEVFIIESLGIDDEKKNLFEGRIISQILHLSNKQSIYYYIRTKAELKVVIDEFKKSKYRYLHLSCHGNPYAMHTTIDEIPFNELQGILCPVLNENRLFLSACSMANKRLAREIFGNSKCFSIVGPKKEVKFNDAAILWASFYHLMFKQNERVMKHAKVEENVRNVASMFSVSMNYYRRRSTKLGFSSKLIKP
ncbi:MAG: hypothetical protein ACYS67_01475 [Planctomycetota bacterium]|jgi:hypothetical protein